MTIGILQQPWPKVPTTAQEVRINAIREACELLRMVMHQAEGSTDPGEHQEHQWSTRRMAHAATLLETAEMFAVKGALE